MNLKTILSPITLLALLTACSGGGGGSTTPPAPVITAPSITSLTATATTVAYGTPVTLNWALAGSPVTKLTLKTEGYTTGLFFDDLNVTATSMTFVPRLRETYILTATNSAGTTSKSIKIVSRGADVVAKDAIAGNIDDISGGMAKDPQGNIYAIDSTNRSTIYKITPQGQAAPFAGSALQNPIHLDGKGTAARFFWPHAIVWSAKENAFLVSEEGCIRRMDLDGNVTTYLTGYDWIYMVIAKDGTLYGVPSTLPAKTIVRMDPTGVVTTITGGPEFFAGPMVLDATEENLIVGGGISGSKTVVINGIPVVQVTRANTISKVNLATKDITVLAGQFEVKGHADGFGTAATFSPMHSLLLDGNTVLVADTVNGLIRRVNLTTNEVTTVAGTLVADPNNTVFKGGAPATAVIVPLAMVFNGDGDLMFIHNSRTADGTKNGGLWTFLEPCHLIQLIF